MAKSERRSESGDEQSRVSSAASRRLLEDLQRRTLEQASGGQEVPYFLSSGDSWDAFPTLKLPDGFLSNPSSTDVSAVSSTDLSAGDEQAVQSQEPFVAGTTIPLSSASLGFAVSRAIIGVPIMFGVDFVGTPDVSVNNADNQPKEKKVRKKKKTKKDKRERELLKRRGKKVQETVVFIRQMPDERRRQLFSDLHRTRDALLRGTYRPGEKHRVLAPLLAAVMRDEETQQEFMAQIDKRTEEESERMRKEAKQGRVYRRILTIGAGPASQAAANIFAEYLDPETFVSIDQADMLGGTLRSFGGPVFYVNSRNFRPESVDQPNGPGSGNLNSSGRRAVVKSTDYGVETYLTNEELGNQFAINHFLSSHAMVGTRVLSVEPIRSSREGAYIVGLNDLRTGQTFAITTDVVLNAGGPGKRRLGLDVKDFETQRVIAASDDRVRKGEFPLVWFSDDLLRHFGNKDNLYPMEPFVGKDGWIIGDGDFGKVDAELFARLAPKQAYRRSVTQLGNVRQIGWSGMECLTQEEYAAKARARYLGLKSFFPRDSNDDMAFLKPRADKAVQLAELSINERVFVVGENGLQGSADFVVIAAGYESNTDDFLGPSLQDKARVTIRADHDGFQSIPVCQQLIGEGIYAIGVANNAPLTEAERDPFTRVEVPENSKSFWVNMRRAEGAAQYLLRRVLTVS